jgi:predicted HAD superfamily Cof-like phosphohydrolase
MRRRGMDGAYTAATFFEDVGSFHRKFNLPATRDGRAHEIPDAETVNYRIKFMEEELGEFARAYLSRDAAGMLDALVDLAWVAMGTAHYMGAPFTEAWDEVVRANMAKVLATEGDAEHKRGPAEVIRKPPGWQAPDIEAVLDRHDREQPR